MLVGPGQLKTLKAARAMPRAVCFSNGQNASTYPIRVIQFANLAR
jgi:hypothetical protein